MTEERKQELQNLLKEAIENLQIRPFGGFDGLSITSDQYKYHLRRAWSSYSENSLWIVQHFTIDVSSNIKSKLLAIMRQELDSFIHEDKILAATFLICEGGDRHGDSLDSFLKQLLKIVIFQGTEEAVSNFERHTEETNGAFQTMTLLGGIKLEENIQVFDGIHLIPLPNSVSDFPTYFGNNISSTSPHSFTGKTLLVIDYTISPIFHKPSSIAKAPDESPSLSVFLPDFGSPISIGVPKEWAKQRDRFKVGVKGSEFPNFREANFRNIVCQALSLACNSAVQFLMRWKYIVPDELFSAGFSHSTSFAQGPFGDSIQVGNTQVEEAKCLYEKLIDPNSNVGEKLEIPINRWIQSKANKDPVDKIVDLGIAFEALYLSGTDYNREIRFRFSLHAAWHLGKDKEHREGLMKNFKAIYDWRSAVVHTGKFPKKGSGKKKRSYTQEEVREFIRSAQDLCRDSIIEILEDGEIPDWNSLILG